MVLSGLKLFQLSNGDFFCRIPTAATNAVLIVYIFIMLRCIWDVMLKFLSKKSKGQYCFRNIIYFDKCLIISVILKNVFFKAKKSPPPS